MSHHHKNQVTMTDEEKLIKLFEHWIKHNEDHAETYRNWAIKIKGKNLGKATAMLEEAVDMTLQINKKFQEASVFIKKIIGSTA